MNIYKDIIIIIIILLVIHFHYMNCLSFRTEISPSSVYIFIILHVPEWNMASYFMEVKIQHERGYRACTCNHCVHLDFPHHFSVESGADLELKYVSQVLHPQTAILGSLQAYTLKF